MYKYFFVDYADQTKRQIEGLDHAKSISNRILWISFRIPIKFERKRILCSRIYSFNDLIPNEKTFRSIRKMNIYHQRVIKSSEGTQAHQKDDLSRKLDQKTHFQNVALSKKDFIQTQSLYDQRYFLKVKQWQDRSPKGALTLCKAS